MGMQRICSNPDPEESMLTMRRKKYTKKKYWAVMWLRERHRDHYDQYTSLMEELTFED
jgi:hypothetical protein